MLNSFLKQFTCPICHVILFNSVLMSDGTPIHKTCATEYFKTTASPKSLTTNEPLTSITLTPNSHINREFNNIITTSDEFDDYILDLTPQQISINSLYTIIFNNKRLCEKISQNKLQEIKLASYSPQEIHNFNTNMFKLISEKREQDAIDFLEKKIINLNIMNNKHDTLLIYACEHKLSKLAQHIISLDISNINSANLINETALIWAIYNNLNDIPIILLKSGAQIHHIDTHGFTALTCACMRNMTDLALKILDYDIPTTTLNAITCSNKSNALLFACENNMITVVTKLLALPNINLANINKKGETALIVACMCKNIDIILLLLHSYKHDNHYYIIDRKDNQGNCALFYACKENLSDVIFEFMKRIPHSDFHLYPNSLHVILIWACTPSHLDLALNILNNESHKTKIDINYEALTRACLNILFPVIETFIINYSIHADYRILGDTLLMWACRHSHSDLALTILAHPTSNPNINETNKIGETSIILACQNKLQTVALQLLKLSPQICKKQKLTTFIYAYKNNLADVIRHILDTTIISPNETMNVYESLESENDKKIFVQMCIDTTS